MLSLHFMNSINTSVCIEELHSNCEILDHKTRNVDVHVDVKLVFVLISSVAHSLMQESYFFKIL